MNKKSIRTLSSLALAVAAASSGAYGAQLEEIIVTAQKRAESLQDVPISMTALSGDKIDDAGVTSFARLHEFVPISAFRKCCKHHYYDAGYQRWCQPVI